MVNPRIVVLLGMHRSGTSLTASILEALGVDFGSDFIPANENNPKGYFENAAITRAQVRFNRLVNRRPFTAAGLVDYPQGFEQSRQALEFVDELEMLVRKELECASGIWGYKDPHTIKLLPLWKTVFERLGVTPVYVLAVRHPSEVAASAAARDHIKADQGELLWLDQNVAALHHTGFDIPVVTDYAAWFADPLPQARRLMEVLGLVSQDDDAGLLAVLQDRIDSSLHRQKHSGSAQLPFAGELYQQLLAVSAGADPRQATESLVNRYRSAKHLFAPAWTLLETEYQRRLAKEQEIELLRHEKDAELGRMKRQLRKIEGIVDTFLGSRTGVLLYQYQVYRRRLFNKLPEGAPLVQLKRILDER